MQSLLLFDLDGTLLNSEKIILAAQARAFAAVGLPVPSREMGLSIVGLSLREAFEVLAGRDGPIDALIIAYKEAFFALRTEGAELEQLFPGVEEMLADLAQRPDLVLGIATGKSQRGVRAILDTYGWNELFVTVQTADDAPSKPDPGMIFNAMRDTGIAPERCFMIGDSSFDMIMAKRAGARAIGVAWGFQPVDVLLREGAEVIHQDVPSLHRALLAKSRSTGLGG
jgi:phosphoglycolate phosphatase